MRAAALLGLLLLAACSREPSFDERYEAQSNRISTTANGIEQELKNQMSGASALQAARSEVAQSASPTTNGSITP